MNKIKLLIVAFVIVAICGCGDKDKFSNNDNNNHDKSNVYYLKAGEMVYDDGLVFGNDAAYWLDFNTMKSTILCNRPNCKHDNPECVARIIGNAPIIFDEYLYFFDVKDGIDEKKGNHEFYINSKLKRISLNTSKIEEVVSFSDCEPRANDGSVLINGTLYFCGDDMNPTEDSYGNIMWSKTGGTHYLCSIDLKSGEYINYGSIYDGDKEYEASSRSSSAKVRGFYNSKIYIQYSFMKEDFSFSESNSNVDARDVFTILNFDFDLDTKEIELSSLPPSSYAQNNTYVYSNYPINASTIIIDDRKIVLDGVDSNRTGKVSNNKLFLNDSWYGIIDGKKHSLGTYTDWRFMGTYEDSYIFSNMEGTEFVKISEEELNAL